MKDDKPEKPAKPEKDEKPEKETEPITVEGEPVLDAEVAHIIALTELVEEGDEDAEMLILAMYLEHSGDKAKFVRQGIALGPYVDMALKAVTDRQHDLTASIEKVVDRVPVEEEPEYEPTEIRVEMVQENEKGVKVPNWAVRDDHEIYSWWPTPEEAVHALETDTWDRRTVIADVEPLALVEIPSADAEVEDPATGTDLSDHSHHQDVD